jgi:hypothetical protein
MIRTVPAVQGVVVLGDTKPTVRTIRSGKATIVLVTKAA